MRFIVPKARAGDNCPAYHTPRYTGHNYCMVCGRRYVGIVKHLYIRYIRTGRIRHTLVTLKPLAAMKEVNIMKYATVALFTLAIMAAFFAGLSYAAFWRPAPDIATAIVTMSDQCHKAPGSATCKDLISQIQRGGNWEVLSSDGIFWAEYKG